MLKLFLAADVQELQVQLQYLGRRIKTKIRKETYCKLKNNKRRR
jgi:hypothetical protein